MPLIFVNFRWVIRKPRVVAFPVNLVKANTSMCCLERNLSLYWIELNLYSPSLLYKFVSNFYVYEQISATHHHIKVH